MSRTREAVREFLGHWPIVVVAAGIVAADSMWIAIAWCLASRLTYVFFVGLSLRAAERRGGGEDSWRRFSVRASWLMENDALSLIALCIVTTATLPGPIPWTLSIPAGVVLVVVGFGVKNWARASLSDGSYYWRNFFVPPATQELVATGPYRWLSNPMYTLGYAHAYGVAVGLQSKPGLVAAGFAQASILLLHVLVERPHLRRLRERTTAG